MATLTYDPTPSDNPEFSADEMDSLAVGERMEQDQQQLLAGKYTDAEQLEKAYLEPQGKLGQPEEEAAEDGKEAAPAATADDGKKDGDEKEKKATEEKK